MSSYSGDVHKIILDKSLVGKITPEAVSDGNLDFCLSLAYISPLPVNDLFLTLAHGGMGRRIDPSWGGPIELFLVPASAPRLV